MKTFAVTAEPDHGADMSVGRVVAHVADAVAISERAKSQIGAQASERKVNLAARFSDGVTFWES